MRESLKPLRVLIAALLIVANAPFAIMLGYLLAEAIRNRHLPNAPGTMVFFGALVVLGPLLAVVSGVRLVTEGRFSIGGQFVAIVVAAVLNFFTAGFIALGGGGGIFAWFLLALLLHAVSFYATVLLAVAVRREAAGLISAPT